jgi:ABC-type nitrate/sulfonate/bicarbonate transport system substrate-binding protein
LARGGLSNACSSSLDLVAVIAAITRDRDVHAWHDRKNPSLGAVTIMHQTRSRREVLLMASGAALLTTPLMRAVSAAAPISIKIANAAGGLNQTMGELMRQQQFLESFGLAPEVIAVADGTRILGGLVSRSVDISTMSGFGQAFPAIERGAPIKILAGGALLPGLALFSAKPEVTGLKKLEGKTIGTGSIGALIYQLTITLLQKYQVNTSGIRFVNVGSSADILRAVSAGTVDAGAGDVALIDQAPAHHVHLIEHGNMSVELKEYTFQGAWTLARNIDSERDALVRTLAAYARLYRFVQDPGSQEAFTRARRTVFPGGPESDSQALWNYIQTYKPFAVDLTLSPERLRYMQQLNISFNVQKELLPFERVADMSLAAEALKLLDTKAIQRGR